MKGELLEKNVKKKVTLFLDTKTLLRLEKIAKHISDGSNKSHAVRFLAKDYEQKELPKEQ